ncbi:MAG: hypothetical protein JWP91_4245 [Fibrobacteres bacterium]|nr:hypothetical protein [Fibrobacterota bacterium]
MLIVVKLFLVAFAIFGQSRLFRENGASPVQKTGLDSVILPLDHPELVLAKRAMEAQGLCRADSGKPVDSLAGSDSAQRSEGRDSLNDMATLCGLP